MLRHYSTDEGLDLVFIYLLVVVYDASGESYFIIICWKLDDRDVHHMSYITRLSGFVEIVLPNMGNAFLGHSTKTCLHGQEFLLNSSNSDTVL